MERNIARLKTYISNYVVFFKRLYTSKKRGNIKYIFGLIFVFAFTSSFCQENTIGTTYINSSAYDGISLFTSTSNSIFSHSTFSERQEQVRNESLNHIPVGL